MNTFKYSYKDLNLKESESEGLIDTKELVKQNICCYTITNNKNEITGYYVRLFQSRLYNPHDNLHKRNPNKIVKFKLVRKEVYDAYVLYLREKRTALFTIAERGL